MQSLALDVHVISEDGGEVQVREEEDELLRAAEELGIDLSPGSLRAAAQPVVEEGQEADEVVELALPEDEVDLGDIELAPGVVADDEDGEPVLPLGEADLADVEIEE
jgi:DNA-directed RNA polymerase subunit beta